jgi:uncharacterized membrane protein YedE/YeeE
MDIAWLWGLVGGLLIGTASAAHLLLNGRVAGLSGMMKALFTVEDDTVLKLAFLVGAFGAAMAVARLWFVPAVDVTTNVAALIVSGLMVGVGVSFASGCTSGHGVSGLSRLSTRSIVAVCTFMACGAIAVFVHRHLLGGIL